VDVVVGPKGRSCSCQTWCRRAWDGSTQASAAPVRAIAVDDVGGMVDIVAADDRLQ
jgi:hypothetical protein